MSISTKDSEDDISKKKEYNNKMMKNVFKKLQRSNILSLPEIMKENFNSLVMKKKSNNFTQYDNDFQFRSKEENFYYQQKKSYWKKSESNYFY